MAKNALTTDVAEAKPKPIKPDPIRALILQLEALSGRRIAGSVAIASMTTRQPYAPSTRAGAPRAGPHGAATPETARCAI